MAKQVASPGEGVPHNDSVPSALPEEDVAEEEVAEVDDVASAVRSPAEASAAPDTARIAALRATAAIRTLRRGSPVSGRLRGGMCTDFFFSLMSTSARDRLPGVCRVAWADRAEGR